MKPRLPAAPCSQLRANRPSASACKAITYLFAVFARFLSVNTFSF
jgi:hypothetical protein